MWSGRCRTTTRSSCSFTPRRSRASTPCAHLRAGRDRGCRALRRDRPEDRQRRGSGRLTSRDARADDGPLALGGTAPEWDASEAWPQLVSSYAIDDGRRLLLFDPLATPNEIVERAAGRETSIVLTAPWHERDTRSLVAQLGAPVFLPPPDTAEDLMQKFRITAEQAAGGSPDVRWLLAGNEGAATRSSTSAKASRSPSGSARK
jgi:hypothetical protein